VAAVSAFDAAIQARFADVELEREQMHDYQADLALPFLLKNPFSGLFISMGMGKTIISATAIVDLILEGHVGKILVVGPLRVMTDTWPTEFRTWRHTAAFKPVLIREDDEDPRIKAAAKIDRQNAAERQWDRETLKLDGLDEADIIRKLGPSEEAKVRLAIRGELARSRATVHFINREQLVWLINFYGPRWPYRTVIIDESSSFKDRSTERFNALKKVRNTPGLITRLHILTATPAAETYEHLFAQIWLLDKGRRLGKNITTYRNDYFTYNKWSMKWSLRKPECEQEILDKIKDIVLVLDAKDYLKVEEATVVKRLVSLPKPAMDLYHKMREDMIVTLPDGTKVEAETAAALSTKLLQIASGVLYETYDLLDADTQDMTKVRRVHRIHDAKLETLKEIHDGLQGSPVMVAYNFKSSLDRLKKAFPKAVVMDRDGKCVKPWNAGKIDMLLIHPQSGGHGLNLQKGPGHNIVFYDLVWSLELWLQLIGRLARQGQANPVLVQVLVAAGTVDELVYGALAEKNDAQDRLFSTLKRLIRKYRKEQGLPVPL
jgi:SNF2 family DNA or RNA helicase